MSFDPRKLARPEIVAIEPYRSAAVEEASRAGYVRLDANENPYPPLIEEDWIADVNRYGAQQPPALIRRLADLYDCAPEGIVAGRGADELIDLLIRVFCAPGRDSVIICPPCFSYYETAARQNGVGVEKAPLIDAVRLDGAAIRAAVQKTRAKIVFLCTPNNPTGAPLPHADILDLARALDDALIVVDEAYVEFGARPSLSRALAAHPNLVVLRTLSKAYGLAGARLGASLSSPEIAGLLKKLLAPYPIPSPVAALAMKALDPIRMPIIRRRIEEIRAAREALARDLASSPDVERIYPSEANFLLIRVRNAAETMARLRAAGLLARDRSSEIENCIRISIGAPEENDVLRAAYGLAGEAPRPRRRAAIVRETKETRLVAEIDLDRASPVEIDTGLPFFDHMLEQIARHGGLSLILSGRGDIEVEAHHLIEDSMLTIGAALREALGDRRGLARFGFVAPMDEAEAAVSIDLSGRPFAKFEGDLPPGEINGFPIEMTPHAFRSLADALGAAIHIRVTGENAHHMVEICFKALGRALRQAICVGVDQEIPSTKGRIS
ncbi:MAG: hypothetical protein Tsb0010_14170 [Parvularculaceae bacterium]